MSLGINVYVINVLRQARHQVGLAADSAAQAVDGLRTTSLDYTVPIRQSLPVSFTVAYKQELVVPISLTLPINTIVSFPLRTPLGTFPIDIPVVTNIPINLQTSVPLSLALPISLTVPIKVDVPIHIDLSQTALNDSLLDAKQYLIDVADGMGVTSSAGPASTPTPR